ncbi:hypothetical protein ABBQ38_013495 [Trebouxia sp. C0009 RCD-2024]
MQATDVLVGCASVPLEHARGPGLSPAHSLHRRHRYVAVPAAPCAQHASGAWEEPSNPRANPRPRPRPVLEDVLRSVRTAYRPSCPTLRDCDLCLPDICCFLCQAGGAPLRNVIIADIQHVPDMSDGPP